MDLKSSSETIRGIEWLRRTAGNVRQTLSADEQRILFIVRVSGTVRPILDVLEECRSTGQAKITAGKIDKLWLAKSIGCETVRALTSAPRLNGYLQSWELQNLAKLRLLQTDASQVEASSLAFGAGSGNVVIFSRRRDDGRIILVPFKINRRVTASIPTLIWQAGIDVEISDYLRYLVLKLHLATSSVEEYAKVLRIFTRYRVRLGLSWFDVDDNVLLAWQASMLAEDIPVPRRNYRLNIVYGFYRWAEQTGRLKYQVCLGRPSDYPKEMSRYQFPITSVEVRTKKGRGWVVSWRTPLTEKIGHGGYGFRNTPNTAQLQDLFNEVSEHGRHAVRNHLMMSWALECGARLSELLQPTLDDLPSEDQIWNMGENDLYAIAVKRKGGKRKNGKLLATADLLLRTLDYVRNERKDVVAICVAAGKKPSNYVFISERSGDVLVNDSVTRLCGKIFRAAKVERANIHRLRASYITRQVEKCLLAVEANGSSVDTTSSWHETILTMAAQLMGHTSILSLRPYLNQLLIRRVQTAIGMDDATEKDIIEAAKIHRFAEENAELIRAVTLRALGKFKEASEILLAQGLASKELAENQILLAA